jgi:AcrR family transcriptional regulator
MTRQQATRWGIDAPASEAEARERILEAAERCYTRHGVERTTVEDVAREAHIHRTTIYTYFRNRDEVFAGVALADSRPIVAASDRIMRGPGRFEDRLVDAFVEAQRAIRASPFLSLLYSPENAAFTMRAAAASDLLREKTRRALTEYVTEAIDKGELRSDVGADAIVSWLTRVHTMLMADPPPDEEGGPAKVLRLFVVASISADPARSAAAPKMPRRAKRP